MKRLLCSSLLIALRQFHATPVGSLPGQIKTSVQYVLIGLVALGAISSQATTKTWDGSSSGNWGTAANWSPSSVPVNGDDLIFPSLASRYTTTNDLSNLRLNSITFNTGNDYTLRGNAITLTNGITSINATPCACCRS